LRRGGSRDRRRRIRAYSRYTETPRHLILELNNDGTDYVARTDDAGIPIAQHWPHLHQVLEKAFDKYTLKRILANWPAEGEAPDPPTFARWLKRATRQGLVRRAGTGNRDDPFCYWLPGHEPSLDPAERISREREALLEFIRERAQKRLAEKKLTRTKGG